MVIIVVFLYYTEMKNIFWLQNFISLLQEKSS